jgi:hypothetical protein
MIFGPPRRKCRGEADQAAPRSGAAQAEIPIKAA